MKYISIDTETYDPYLSDKGPSWVYGEGEILVTGLYDCQARRKGFLDGDGGNRVKAMLLDAETTLIGANLAYDFGWLCYSHRLQVKDTACGLIDIQVAESFIDEYQPYSLEDLARKYLGENKGSGKLPDLALKLGLKGDFRKHMKTLWEVYPAEVRKYVVSDADQPARIWKKQKNILENEEVMDSFLLNMKMLKITVKMKQRGVRIDYAKWRKNGDKCREVFDNLNTVFIHKYGTLNINSPKQMAKLMLDRQVPFQHKIVVRGYATSGSAGSPTKGKFTKADWFSGDAVWTERKKLKEHFAGIRVIKGKLSIMVDQRYAERTASQLIALGYDITNNPSINKAFFQKQKGNHQVVKDIMDMKQVKNLLDKFFGEKFERFLVHHSDTEEWRLHGNFNVVGARQTSRVSSANPNMQNVPSKTVVFEGTPSQIDLAEMCREVFLPEKDELFVKLDYHAQEVALAAHFAVGENGKRVRQMYKANPRFDEHQFVANVSGLQEEHGNKIGRKLAKACRFLLAYGGQLTTLMEQFGWEKEFAENVIQQVKDASPWFSETMEAVQRRVLEKEFIRTLAKRKIHLRKGHERDAYKFYNYLIQGSAADMLKAATVAIDETESCETLVLTVHDENCFSLPRTPEGLKRLQEIQSIMETANKLDVPIICDPEMGSDWAHVEGQEKNETTSKPIETVDELWDRISLKLANEHTVSARVFEDDEPDIGDEEDNLDDDEVLDELVPEEAE